METLENIIKNPLPPIENPLDQNKKYHEDHLLQPPTNTPLKEIANWTNFEQITVKRCSQSTDILERRVPIEQNSNDRSPQQALASRVIHPILKALKYPNVGIIYGNENRNSIVLLEPHLALTYNNQCVLMVVLTASDYDIAGFDKLHVRDKKSSALCLRCHCWMLVNNCKIGLITNYEHTWILKREGHVDNIVLISDKIARSGTGTSKSLISSIFSVFLDAWNHEQWNYRNSTFLTEYNIPIMRNDSVTIYEKFETEGLLTTKIQIDEHSYVQLKNATITKYQHDTKISYCRATLKQYPVNSQLNQFTVVAPTIAKITSINSSYLDKNMQIYEQLLPLQGLYIPMLVLAGTFWNIGKCLLFEGAGIRLKKNDLNEHIAQQMKEIIRNVHECGVLHGNIRLSSFVTVPPRPRSRPKVQTQQAACDVFLTGFEHAIREPTIEQKHEEFARVEDMWNQRQNREYWLSWA